MGAAPWPLLSCVMPTRGRPGFVAQAVAHFQRQDYPALELIVVYEHDEDLPPALSDPRVRRFRVAAGSSIGAKRNRGAQLARGELIAQWDDDDWHGPRRLSRQAAPILDGRADISGLNDILFLSSASGQYWHASPALFARMFVENVSGGTLVFRRALWESHGPYPETSMREDADFLRQALRGGARLCRLPGRDIYTYVRHAGNTWKFEEGRYMQADQWRQVAASSPPEGFEPMPLHAQASSPPEPFEGEWPVAAAAPPTGDLVSCIMPTADRREFVPQAIRNFLAQDHAARELIVIDDGRDSVADLMPQHESVRYIRLDRRSTLGAKRNIACELARGEWIAHWDDDDWMGPAWLGSQLGVLRDQGADICGLDKVFFYAPATRRAWQYVYDGRAPWVCGGTLLYRREHWRASPFPDINVGEDNAFVWSPQPKRIAVNPDRHLYVARVHAGNTSPRDTQNRRWRAFPVEQVERLMA